MKVLRLGHYPVMQQSVNGRMIKQFDVRIEVMKKKAEG